MSLFIHLTRKNIPNGHLFCLRGGLNEIGEDSFGIPTDKHPIHSLIHCYPTSPSWCIKPKGQQALSIDQGKTKTFSIGEYMVTARLSFTESECFAYQSNNSFSGLHECNGVKLKTHYYPIIQEAFVPFFTPCTIGSSPTSGMCIPLGNMPSHQATLLVTKAEATLCAPDHSILSSTSIERDKASTLLLEPLDIELQIFALN